MAKSRHIHKSHNVSVLIYHLVYTAKYRRVIFSNEVDLSLKQVCIDLSLRYEIYFLEIGTDDDHVHFLIQAVPTYSPSRIARIVKSITAREVFKRNPEVKKQLWGGEFWGKGYFVNTVGEHGNEDVIANYVKNQGTQKQYKQLHKETQLKLF